MQIVIAIAMVLVIVIPTFAEAATNCTTRKSGSYTKTSCSSSGHNARSSHCTSYMSGSVRKTSCR